MKIKKIFSVVALLTAILFIAAAQAKDFATIKQLDEGIGITFGAAISNRMIQEGFAAAQLGATPGNYMVAASELTEDEINKLAINENEKNAFRMYNHFLFEQQKGMKITEEIGLDKNANPASGSITYPYVEIEASNYVKDLIEEFGFIGNVLDIKNSRNLLISKAEIDIKKKTFAVHEGGVVALKEDLDYSIYEFAEGSTDILYEEEGAMRFKGNDTFSFNYYLADLDDVYKYLSKKTITVRDPFMVNIVDYHYAMALSLLTPCHLDYKHPSFKTPKKYLLRRGMGSEKLDLSSGDLAALVEGKKYQLCYYQKEDEERIFNRYYNPRVFCNAEVAESSLEAPEIKDATHILTENFELLHFTTQEEIIKTIKIS